MAYVHPRIRPEGWDAQSLLGFWDARRLPNLDQTTRPGDNQQIKRICWMVVFAVPAAHRLELKESKKKNYLDLAGELKNESFGDTNYDWYSWYSQKRIETWPGGLGNKWTSGGHQNYSIIKIVRNNEESPGDLRWLAVNKTPVRNHQLTLV